MTITTGNRYSSDPAAQRRTRHILLRDDLGCLVLRRLRPWHRILARGAAARLDRELAAGASPETSAILAARAVHLTSMKTRRDLAISVQRILVAVGQPPAVTSSRKVASRPPRLPLRRAEIIQAAVPLAGLAACLAAPGPVPVQAAALVSQLLADGTGPLYREACGDDLCDIIQTVTR